MDGAVFLDGTPKDHEAKEIKQKLYFIKNNAFYTSKHVTRKGKDGAVNCLVGKALATQVCRPEFDAPNPH